MAIIISTVRRDVSCDYEDISIRASIETSEGVITRSWGSLLISENQIGNFDKNREGALNLFLPSEHVDKLSLIASRLPEFFTELNSIEL